MDVTNKLIVYYTNEDCLLNKINGLEIILIWKMPDMVFFPQNCNALNVNENESWLQAFFGNLSSNSRGVVKYVKENIPFEKYEHLNDLPFKEVS